MRVPRGERDFLYSYRRAVEQSARLNRPRLSNVGFEAYPRLDTQKSLNVPARKVNRPCDVRERKVVGAVIANIGQDGRYSAVRGAEIIGTIGGACMLQIDMAEQLINCRDYRCAVHVGEVRQGSYHPGWLSNPELA